MNETSLRQAICWVPKAAEIAREAGARLREFFAQGVETEYKGDVDLVTVADRTVEKLIRSRLAEVFPDHGIYGEEGTRERLEREFRWYVDPLDGTTNFAHGFPQFCVSMGLEQRPRGLEADRDGTLVAGVIYDPLRDELFTAERGKGAFLNGKTDRTFRALLNWPRLWFLRAFPAASVTPARTSTSIRSSPCARTACGAPARRRSIWPMSPRPPGAFWEFNLNPWDTAAGILLVEEAGGRVTDFAGNPFQLASREILASNGRIHDELHRLLLGHVCRRDLSPIPTPGRVGCAAPTPDCEDPDSSATSVPVLSNSRIAKRMPRGPASSAEGRVLLSASRSYLSGELKMAYVIAEPCIGTKDTACVDACPVDCIHPKKDEAGHAEADQLFIDPVECIDCGACVPACPVSAIFAQDDLPEKWAQFTEKNAAHFGR